ncbi:rhodanese-like domain-containing protein [Streptomyces sp. SID13726]|uniref:rhodanese-like domain-containing protein n=1 Tax=Streptomyces sp. SID13726 TaxID=2706058 RepID=UPI001EF2E217|nr:rhodanese-like domain-containing protein [Streptomyces sp. SID13726]
MARITAAQAHERTGTEGTAVLLDVREREEWAAGHAPGAVHAPLSALLAGGRLPEAAANRPVVTVCRSGKRSRAAVALLEARGVDAVDVLGGMAAWVAAGLPVTGGSPAAGRVGRDPEQGDPRHADAHRTPAGAPSGDSAAPVR